MKCRKCGFINSDYLENCRKCQSDLTEIRSLLGLSPYKPEKINFVSRLLPHAESPEIINTAEQMFSEPPPSMVAESLPESPAAALDASDFSLPQLDFSELMLEKPEAEPAQTEVTPDIASPVEAGFPDLDLVALDLEAALREESAPAETKSAESAPAPEGLPFDLDDQSSLEFLLNGMPQEDTEPKENELQEIKLESDLLEIKTDKEDDTKPPAPPAASRGTGKGRGRRKTKNTPVPENPEINLCFEKAGLGQRILAYCFDCTVVMLVSCSFILGVVAAGKIGLETANQLNIYSAMELAVTFLLPLQFCILAVISGYYVFFHGYLGQTPGKMVFGIKVVHSSGLPVGFSQAFLRWTGFFLGLLPLNLGLIWAVFDENRQGWHDKITDTVVIRTR